MAVSVGGVEAVAASGALSVPGVDGVGEPCFADDFAVVVDDFDVRRRGEHLLASVVLDGVDREADTRGESTDRQTTCSHARENTPIQVAHTPARVYSLDMATHENRIPVGLAITFDEAAVTAAFHALTSDGREDLREATERLHETTSYADVCDYFADTLGGRGEFLDANAAFFGVTGTAIPVDIAIGIEPVYPHAESAMIGVDVVVVLTLLDGPHANVASKTARRFYDDERPLRGDNRDPLATVMTLGRNVVNCLNSELSAAEDFDAGTAVIGHLRNTYGGVWGEHPAYPVKDWRYQVANGDTRQGYWEWVVSELELADGH